MDPALHAVGFSLTGEHLFITRYSISIYKQVEIKQQKQQQKYNTQKTDPAQFKHGNLSYRWKFVQMY